MVRRSRLTWLLFAALWAVLAFASHAEEDAFFPGWRSRSWPQVPALTGPGPLDGWRLVIDPGHGGEDSGACPGTAVCEKEFNLAISQKLNAILQTYGATVLMTRTSDQTVALDDRINFANANKAHRFLSVHINSATATARGIETWVDADGTNPSVNPAAEVWRSYAQTIHNNLIQGARSIDSTVPDRGLKFSGTTPPWSPGRIRVIRYDLNNSPAALVEIGFISNATDYALLLRDDYQHAVAFGMAQGFLHHAADFNPEDGVRQ